MQTLLRTAEIPAALWKISAVPEFIGVPSGLIRDQAAASRWIDDQAQRLRLTFVGGATRQVIEETLHPRSYMRRERANRNGRRSVRRGSGSGKSAIFREHPWEEVAVIPFELAPGKICGFAFADADVTRPTEFLFRSYARPSGGLKEAGLAMIGSAHAETVPDLQGCLFIMLDLGAAVLLQMKWCRSSCSTLPLVVPRDDERYRTVEAWQHIPQAERILLSATADARTFRQARLAGAKLVIAPELIDDIKGPPAFNGERAFPDLHTAIRYGTSPRAIARILRRRAQEWTAVLHSEMFRHAPSAALELLNGIGMSRDDKQTFLETSSYPLKQNLKKSGDANLFAPRVVSRGHFIVERDGGWFAEATGVRITDAVRVTRILSSTAGIAWADGHVVLDGSPTEFRLPKAEVHQRGLLACLRTSLGTQGKTFDFKNGWSKRSFGIATSLHGPEIIDKADAVGWDGCAFRFPGFGISNMGFTTDAATALTHSDQPAQSLGVPGPLVREDLRPITMATPDASLFWAVARVVVLYAAAPAYRNTIQSCALIGEHGPAVAKALSEFLGCTGHVAPRRCDAHIPLKKLSSQTQRHAWPAVIHMPRLSPNSARKLLTRLPRFQCFIVGSEGMTIAEAAKHGVWAIDGRSGDRAADLLREFGPAVVLHYLASLRANHMNYQGKGGWSEAIWQDFRHWFGKIGRGGLAHLESEQLLHSIACSPGG